MIETREIIGHARHKLQGPHVDWPSGFVPLKLYLEASQLHIEIVCSVAIVGRHSDADLRFAYPEVSRRHCRLAFEHGQWRVHDLQSLNGIFVNNQQIVDATLYAGDDLRVGCIKLLVEAATPISLAEEQQHAKLRQIVEVLPAS